MTTDKSYSLNYRSTADDSRGGIAFPSQRSDSIKASSALGKTDSKDDGTVITPEPFLVIKTKLLRSDGCGSKQSILNIANGDAASGSTTDMETKIFINVCMHNLISLPTKRKTIDEETGKEVDGWHLPMSMGELRPCFDKNGNAAIVADCIMNPSVVKDMQTDSNHCHFVCDLVIQCATRKFSKPCFGGCELDKRYKVPKMKYAGYVDEKSGLPTDARMCRVNQDINPVVAKQRIKGGGRSRPLIEELDSAPTVTPVDSVKPAKVDKPEPQRLSPISIELFVEDDENTIPLQDYLNTLAIELPVGALQRRILSAETLQIPIPLLHLDRNENSTLTRPVGIVARCVDSTPDIALEVSCLQLILSSKFHSKTECVLPFPVNSHKTKCTFDARTDELEIKMPLLQSLLKDDNEGPDPGTKQWELANAFSRERDENDNNLQCNSVSKIESFTGSNTNDDAASVVQEQELLPEDIFHSQDALSRHYILQQKEEKSAKHANHENISAERGVEDVEVIDVKDFRPGGKYFGRELMEQSVDEVNNCGDGGPSRKVEDVMKESLDGDLTGKGLEFDIGLAFGLV
jgi:hypothetical protein